MKKQERSPFYSDKNKADRIRIELHAKTLLQDISNLRNDAHTKNYDYGKWLLASLLAINLGGIAILTQTGEKALELFILSGHWLTFGAIAAMVSGFFAWINWGFIARTYDDWYDPAMLYRDDCFPSSKVTRTDPILATYFLSIAFGILSLFATICASTAIYQKLVSLNIGT